jgi:F420-dependent oxidoreductase-like protein
MRFGLSLPHYGYSFGSGEELTWPRVVDAAVAAEAAGFDSVWVSDHFLANLSRYGGPDGPVGTFEPFTALAAIATRTERVRLGTLVAAASFRHPAHVAKMSTTIDLLSGGRFELGLGAGWNEEEYEAFGYEFGSVGDRFDGLEDALGVLTHLFADEEPVSYEGKVHRLQDAYLQPRPAQPGGPPIWLGGKGGPRGLRLAARHASGWNTVWRWTPEDYAELVRRLEEACEAEGRDPATLRRSVGLYTLIGEDERDLDERWRALQRWAPGDALAGELLEHYARGALVGTPERIRETVAAFEALGVEELILAPASLPFAVPDPSQLDVVAEVLLTRD